MNLNINLEDPLINSISSYAKHYHLSLDAIINEAIRAWLLQHENKKWPESILKFQGSPNMPPFESYRNLDFSVEK